MEPVKRLIANDIDAKGYAIHTPEHENAREVIQLARGTVRAGLALCTVVTVALAAALVAAAYAVLAMVLK